MSKKIKKKYLPIFLLKLPKLKNNENALDKLNFWSVFCFSLKKLKIIFVEFF